MLAGSKSAGRAAYGREKLGVRIDSSAHDIPSASIDLIHTAHVLEHIGDLRPVFSEFHRLLEPGGVALIFVPNAGGRAARALGTKWGPTVSEKHVNALTAAFLTRALTDHGFIATNRSSPFAAESVGASQEPDLEGEELLVIATKVGQRSLNQLNLLQENGLPPCDA